MQGNTVNYETWAEQILDGRPTGDGAGDGDVNAEREYLRGAIAKILRERDEFASKVSQLWPRVPVPSGHQLLATTDKGLEGDLWLTKETGEWAWRSAWETIGAWCGGLIARPIKTPDMESSN